MTDRVLFLVPAGYESKLAADHFATALRDAGDDCLLCDVSTSPSTDSGWGISVGRARPWDVVAIARTRQLISRFRPDIIYVIRGDADRFALVAAANFAGPVVLQRDTALSRVDTLLRPRQVHLLAGTHAAKQRLETRHALGSIRVVRASYPVANEQRRTKQQLAHHFSLPDNAKLIGVVADFRPDDLLRDVVWVADLIKAARDHTHVLVFGDGPERLRLERYRRCVEIEDCVHFLSTPHDLTAWLAGLDCFWCAAGDDSVRSSVYTALGLGLPIVASSTAGHRELIQHEANGLLFPVGNRAHFGRQALRVLEEPGLSDRLAEAAVGSWQREFTHEKTRADFLDCHHSIRCQSRSAA